MAERVGAITRRRFLAGAALGVASTAWAPVFRRLPADATSACPAPPDFPAGIELYQQAYENWAKAIRVDDAWTCVPRSPDDVVRIANWAHRRGYQVRARGMMHGWSPLTLPAGTSCEAKVVLADTTQHLTSMALVSGTPAAVHAQAGATMEALLDFLEVHGFGLTATPAPGDVTVGGVLAIGGHGAAVPAAGEAARLGDVYGSLSNRVLTLTAVVWNERSGSYELRTFDRGDRDCKAFLVHLGRAFVTDVTLLVAPNSSLRCVSRVDIAAADLFEAPHAGGDATFASFVEQAGRAEAIWFPFTDDPWLKVWSIEAEKPGPSRATNAPYNYPFSDNIPDDLARLADQVVTGHAELTPLFGRTSYQVSADGLAATQSADLWGPSKNTLLYIKPTTLRVTANGYAVLTTRARIQQVIHDFVTFYLDRVSWCQARGDYPMNMPVEIRVTGVDDPAQCGVDGAEAPVLSALTPRVDHPEWDVAVWFDILTFPDTPGSCGFYRETEQWMLRHYSTDHSTIRPEWSKGWGYTNMAAWADWTMLHRTIPDLYRTGRPASADWDWAVATLHAHDPHHVFSSSWLDSFLR